jgi:hypothetical protein
MDGRNVRSAELVTLGFEGGLGHYVCFMRDGMHERTTLITLTVSGCVKAAAMSRMGVWD